MLKAEEVASFLDKAQRISAEWTSQVQFMREEFIPQVDILNQRILERSHVPDIARDVLTSFMTKSNEIEDYYPHSFVQSGQSILLDTLHKEINTHALMAILFPEGIHNSLGVENDFTLYFDAYYKDIVKGCSKNWSRQIRIYTNFDFYIGLEVVKFEEVAKDRSGNTAIQSVPLSGDKVTRDQLKITYHPLSVPARPITDPNPAQLKSFLAQRKPYIHPVIVLDYIRKQDLPVVSAFFADVAQYDLASVKNELDLRGIQGNIASVEIAELKKSLKTEVARSNKIQQECATQQEENKQQRKKLFAAAVQIKRLQKQLKETEQMYEEALQMRLVDGEGLDDVDFGDLELGDDFEENDTVQTDKTHAVGTPGK